MEKTPVTIFSGYLGSGKTTIILWSLKHMNPPPRLAMIKNEYGDASVDGTLAKMSSLAVKELVNGCLCCILVGSLNDAVNELIDTIAPERILIEASGDALPFPIVLELKKNPRVYVDGVISVVDCVNFERVKDTSIVARDQAKHTDLIIFNKTGMVDEDKLYRVKEEISGINPDTMTIETTDGVVDPAILFGLEHRELIENTAHTHEHHHELETFYFSTKQKLDREKVNQVLAACKQNAFYRIKGIVAASDSKSYLVNGVFGRLTWTELSKPIKESRIIFIGKKIAQFEPVLADYLSSAVVPE
jgi:G3E family GTPase